MFSLDPYIEPTDYTSHRGALLKKNYSLTNLFSDEQGRMLKSHLCVRGNKAQTSQMAMVYEISTKDRNRFAIQRKRQQFSVQKLKRNLSILYTSLHKFDQITKLRKKNRAKHYDLSCHKLKLS